MILNSSERTALGVHKLDNQHVSYLENINLDAFLTIRPSVKEAKQLAEYRDTELLMSVASTIRDEGFRNVLSYSRKVFMPITQLCRDVCHYCTFAKTPKNIQSPYMSVDEVLESAHKASLLGCKEALFTLGERPEIRYSAARDALSKLGYSSTLEYLAYVAKRVMEETELLVHINAGCMSRKELKMLRPVSASMGIMLESSSERLCEKGMPHYGSPDKQPSVRLNTIRLAGEESIPFTSGILIGIGETRLERIESLLALRELHSQHGHLQEIIIQNFRAKKDTKMSKAQEPDLDDLQWTIAITRIIFGPKMSIQAPPNLSPGVVTSLVDAGINDWGGISPLTPDFVNPEAPWPNIENLTKQHTAIGRFLHERLTIYPNYVLEPERWLDTSTRTKVIRNTDALGFPRTDKWLAGHNTPPPAEIIDEIGMAVNLNEVATGVQRAIKKARHGHALTEKEIIRLFAARGTEFAYIVQQANRIRAEVNGDKVQFVVNRNINYTNVCYFKCQFCAFSKGKHSEDLRGKPYDLDLAEIHRRVVEARQRGATEVCMQGGIHPRYTGQTYLDILATVKAAAPEIHVHAFSPLEVWQGAHTMGISIANFLRQLKAAGLGSLPGTAAEILDDEVRQKLCADKINTEQWLEVIRTAHQVDLPTTATIMFGHVDHPRHWARHLLRVRALQSDTGGFTEFVPLPFVHLEAPMYLKGNSRKGPTFREAVLMHSISRLVLHKKISNIQASWVKLGDEGVQQMLKSGCNDLGGTLMNETITRAAGAVHGQEKPSNEMHNLANKLGRCVSQRTTLYQTVSPDQIEHSKNAGNQPLSTIINTPLRKQGSDKGHLHRNI